MDFHTQKKWDRAAGTFDIMAGKGPENRWRDAKRRFFSAMRPDSNILFLAMGTGLDITCFPTALTIQSIDISSGMLAKAQPRIAAYDGTIEAKVMDVHNMDFEDNHFDQVFTSCTFCSVPNPVEGLKSLKRVLKPGGELHMFEHTGSTLYPFSMMLHLMTLLTSKIGPDMDRKTTDNVRKAGFELERVNNLFLDVVKTIHARKPA